MNAWIYDWEVYYNFACVSFIHHETPKVYIDAYKQIDIKYLACKNQRKEIESKDNYHDYELQIEYQALIEEIKRLLDIKTQILGKANVQSFIIYKDESDSSLDINNIGELLTFFNTHKILYGYNSYNYDSIITDWFLIHARKYDYKTGKNHNNIHICQELKFLSDEIISKSSTDVYFNNYAWKPKYYKRPYIDYDIQKILYLDKTFVGLKSVAINLKWHRLQELPIHHNNVIKSHQCFTILDYNINDILITLELVDNQIEEIHLRDKISDRYGIDFRNDSRSSIGKKLMARYYSDYTGLQYKDFRDLRTQRGRMSLSSIITDRVYFQTDKFKAFLKEIKSSVITPGDEWTRKFECNGTYYNIAKGGIHSIDDSMIYDMYADNCIYKDADINEVVS